MAKLSKNISATNAIIPFTVEKHFYPISRHIHFKVWVHMWFIFFKFIYYSHFSVSVVGSFWVQNMSSVHFFYLCNSQVSLPCLLLSAGDSLRAAVGLYLRCSLWCLVAWHHCHRAGRWRPAPIWPPPNESPVQNTEVGLACQVEQLPSFWQKESKELFCATPGQVKHLIVAFLSCFHSKIRQNTICRKFYSTTTC